MDVNDNEMGAINDNSFPNNIEDESIENIEDLSFLDGTHFNEEIDEDDNVDEAGALREWALHYIIKHAALDKLLLILRKRLLPQLPKSSKTFLQTKSHIKINVT